MVATIPNDIFQYSLSTAFHAPHALHTGGPPAAFLTRHGTHGVGFFPPDDSAAPGPAPDVCALVDSTAWRVSAKDGGAVRAQLDARLPFVMVTVFEPVWKVRGGFGREGLREVLCGGGGERGGPNSYMPFRVTGTFARVSCRVGAAGAAAEQESRDFANVKGTIFGFYNPPWAETVSGTGLHCVFLSSGAGSQYGTSGERVGGQERD